MGRIYCVMGKSSSGKDSVYRRIMEQSRLPLERIIPYTTRPRREGEQDGREYVFTKEAQVQQLTQAKKVIELRAYHTVYGIWKYFTVDDGHIDLAKHSYLYIVTLEGYLQIQAYFGEKAVVPIYIEVEDGERLMRAIERERQQKKPQYEEMCRRFLADASDFSEEKLAEAGITRRFVNRDMDETIQQITEYIRKDMAKAEEAQ